MFNFLKKIRDWFKPVRFPLETGVEKVMVALTEEQPEESVEDASLFLAWENFEANCMPHEVNDGQRAMMELAFYGGALHVVDRCSQNVSEEKIERVLKLFHQECEDFLERIETLREPM